MIKNIVYRQADSVDEKEIRKMMGEFRSDKSLFDINKFIVAKINNKLVGCVRIKELTNDCFELASLAVDNEYRHQGIGGKLIEILLLKESVRPIYLLTSKDKELFYNKFHFVIIEPEKLVVDFKVEYDRIISMPFAKAMKVIAMVLI